MIQEDVTKTKKTPETKKIKKKSPEIKHIVEESMKEKEIPIIEKNKEVVLKKSGVESDAASTKPFFIALGLLLIVLVAVFLIPHLFAENGPKTLTDLHNEVIDGDESETAYLYNGYSFVYYDDLWYTQIVDQFSSDIYDVPLHYGPRQLDDIVVTGDLNEFFSGVTQGDIEGEVGRYYLTFDPNREDLGYVTLAAGEMSISLVTTFNMAPVSACSTESEACGSVSIITCDNTDNSVIYLSSGSPTMVSVEGNCVTIQGNDEELVRAVDRFILKLYNVME